MLKWANIWYRKSPFLKGAHGTILRYPPVKSIMTDLRKLSIPWRKVSGEACGYADARDRHQCAGVVNVSAEETMNRLRELGIL